MDSIDLVKFIRAFKTNTISQVEVYGKITKRVKRPDNITSNVKVRQNGMFVQIDIFAVNLSNYASYLKQNGYTSPDDIYMVNGSMITYIEKDKYKLPDWFKLFGTVAISKDTSANIVSIFKWVKNNGDWAIDNIFLDDLNTSVFEKNEIINVWFNKCIETDEIRHPDYVNNLTKFYAKKEVFNTNYKGLDVELANAINRQPVQYNSNQNIVGKFNKESRETIKPFSNSYDLYKSKYREEELL